MRFKPRFMCSVPNPSQALVVDASHGCYSELPIACEVQWWHHGEDGAVPRVVDLRGPIEIDSDFQFDEMQEWFVDEFLDLVYLQSEPEDDEPLPAPRAWACPEANPWPITFTQGV